MTCYRKRRFANPVKDENRNDFDKFVISGNCNRCAGCAKQKQNDWLVRSYFEYMSDDYDCFFVTLDFDDQHRPHYNGTPCFDTKIMHTFFESFRQGVGNFRYLYSCHLGEALHNPHYHVVFLFPKGSYSVEQFWVDLPRYWHYGKHQDISLLRSVKGNPMSAFQYVCRYTVFSYKVHKTFEGMPYRYRPHVSASPGYGAQCLNPDEFSCVRLKQLGLKFFETPLITKDFLLENNVIYIDINRDGILVPMSIPQYYYYKLCFDYSYDCVEKKVSQVRNETFLELQKIRHNAHYIHLYDEFTNSRSIPIHDDIYVMNTYREIFPHSPYLGLQWSDVVDDVLIDKDRFYDFCKFYNWMKFDLSLPNFYRYRPLSFGQPDSLQMIRSPLYRFFGYSLKHRHFESASVDGSCSLFDFDDCIDLYIYAMSLYQIWKHVESFRKADYEDWKIQEEVKKKIKSKCISDKKFYFHLRRKNFKFYTLNPKVYVSRYPSCSDCFQEQSPIFRS